MTEHWCKEHEQVWFKKGKMKGYAHPLTGEGWCNEPKLVEGELPAPVPVNIPAEPPKPDTGKAHTQDDTRTRSMALSYAKDLAVGKIIEKDSILPLAQLFADWLEQDFRVEFPESPLTPIIKTKPEPQPVKVEALRPTNVVNAEDLKTKLKDLYNAKPKKITGPELVASGVTKWADMDGFDEAKLLEITKAIEGK